ncbi:hypothetical protein FB567DRAFT_590856 [Paraphoma chrysanthemicola]|uniref:Uncharacterized protein n=1 Tax=Paraphoma chrysanthemicola TaxID=798071 RepID=A0A8K0RAR5_9PLEO|nr:hypothetical protein FB567DRAFT_590856 [Paraphoma chrysanthemicola]
MDLFKEDSLHKHTTKRSESPYHFLSKDEDQYMCLIQNELQPFFPTFAAAIEKQSASQREKGRCAVVDFTEQQQHRVVKFASSSELNTYLAETPPPAYHETEVQPRRRLFILEDLPCNHILALGSRLRIPPGLFAGHWDDPAASTFNHRDPCSRCALPHFRIRYGTSNRVEIDAPADLNNAMGTYAFDTNVCRYLHNYNPNGLLYDEPRSHHIMSFWTSAPREDGTWDAVLLVDPPPQKHVRCLATHRLLPLRDQITDDASMPKRFLNPPLDTPHELSEDLSKWSAAYSRPAYISMFDDTIQAYGSGHLNISVTSDPLRAVEYPRKLAMSTLLAYIRRRYLNIINVHKSQGSNSLRHYYFSNFSNSNMTSWSTKFFDFWIGSCAAMKEFSHEMDENITALGLDVANPSAPAWEIDGWRSIRENTHVVQVMIDTFAANYLQYVTVQEAHASSGSAQSLSRITVLTMLFIPLSTVASIFSMGGDFLPGETKAWIFWVIVIPVLAMLACVYWYGMLVRMWTCKKKSILPTFEVKDWKQRISNPR